MTAVAVLGSGSWGTAFAKVLADAGADVTLWGRRAEVADEVNDAHTQLRSTCRISSCRSRSGPRPTARRRSPTPRSSCWRCRRRACAGSSAG